MRSTFLIISAFMLLTAWSCRGKAGSEGSAAISADTGNAVLVFKEYEHHFGKVIEGEKVSWQFTFENTGTGTLVLKSVTTSCGCTAPRYDRKPISPGGSGRVEVVFNTSGFSGMQTKTISVASNATVPVIMLRITAEVQKDI